MTFREQIAYRAKAVLTAVGVAVVAFLGWLVENPATAEAIEQVVPAPYAQFVPLLLAGIAATWLVHRVPNRAPVDPEKPPVTELPDTVGTTMIPLPDATTTAPDSAS